MSLEFNASPETIPHPRMRLAKILELIKTAKAARFTSDAYKIVAKSFQEVENDRKLNIPIKDQMTVDPFELMYFLLYKELTVHFTIYKSHILFLGQNGAIEIATKHEQSPVSHRLLESNIDFCRQKMFPILDKAGADGKNVWGETIV